jgi:hypothetical protein
MNWFFIEIFKNKGKLINIKFHSKWFRVIKYVLCYGYLKIHSYMETFIENFSQSIVVDFLIVKIKSYFHKFIWVAIFFS